MTAEDSDEIDKLQSLISEIRLQKKGALALSADSQEELDLLENQLNKAEKTIGNLSLEELRNEESRVDDIANSVLVDNPNLTKEELLEAMGPRLEEEEVSKQAIDNWTVERAGDKLVALQSRDFQMTPADQNTFFEGLNKLGNDYEAREQYVVTYDGMPEKVRAARLHEIRAQKDAEQGRYRRSLQPIAGLMKNVERLADMQYNSAAEAGGVVDLTDASVLSESRVQSASNAVMDAAEDADRRNVSDEERDQLIRAAVIHNDKLWSQVTINGGADYNVERARELAIDNPEIFPPEILRTMEQISQQAALTSLMPEAVDPVIGATPEQLGLETGAWYWYDRAMVSNVNDVANLLTEPETAPRNAQINDLNRETRADAAAYIQGAVKESDTENLTVFGGAAYRPVITPNGVEDVFGEGPLGGSRGVNEDRTRQLEQALRLAGRTPEQIRNKDWAGLDPDLEKFKDFKNPQKTLMVNPDTFVDDLSELASIPDGLSPEELQEQYGSNGIVAGYLAYRDWVGINDAIPFSEGPNNFLALTLKGIGTQTLPVPDNSVLKALNSE